MVVPVVPAALGRGVGDTPPHLLWLPLVGGISVWSSAGSWWLWGCVCEGVMDMGVWMGMWEGVRDGCLKVVMVVMVCEGVIWVCVCVWRCMVMGVWFKVQLVMGVCGKVWYGWPGLVSCDVLTTSYSLGQRGQRDMGCTSSSPFKISMSRNPGNHSSTRASTLSTTAHSSLQQRAIQNCDGTRCVCLSGWSSAAFFISELTNEVIDKLMQ